MSLIVNDDMDPFYKELEQSVASKVFDVFWKFANLEDQIDWLIVNYYIGSSNTTRASEFLDDILRNDTMSFNSKVRILGSIAEHNEVKLDSRDLHACRDLRNRFAHGRYSCIDEEDLETGETLPMYFQNKSGERGQRDTIDKSHAEFVRHYSAAYNQVGELSRKVSKCLESTVANECKQSFTTAQPLETKKLKGRLSKVRSQFSQLEDGLNNIIRLCGLELDTAKSAHNGDLIRKVDLVNRISLPYSIPSISRKQVKACCKAYSNISHIISDTGVNQVEARLIHQLKNEISRFEYYNSRLQARIDSAISQIQKLIQAKGTKAGTLSANMRQHSSKSLNKEQYEKRLKILAVSGIQDIKLLSMSAKTAGTVKSYTFQWRIDKEGATAHLTSALPSSSTDTTPQLFMRQILVNSHIIMPDQTLSKLDMETMIIDNMDGISEQPLQASIKPIGYVDDHVEALVELMDNPVAVDDSQSNN